MYHRLLVVMMAVIAVVVVVLVVFGLVRRNATHNGSDNASQTPGQPALRSKASPTASTSCVPGKCNEGAAPTVVTAEATATVVVVVVASKEVGSFSFSSSS